MIGSMVVKADVELLVALIDFEKAGMLTSF